MQDVQLRILASAILYRASLRALAKPPTPAEKMALHARVEETAWGIPDAMLREVEGREVDDGIPEGDAWRALVAQLADVEGTGGRRA